MRATEKILLTLPFKFTQKLGGALFGSEKVLSLPGSEEEQQKALVPYSLFPSSLFLSLSLFANPYELG